ncbi:MAG: Smr/MutS family protein [Bacteroidota bacterium]
MLYTIGTRVKLKRTGDLATVSAILDEGMIEVKLDDGLGYIPVPADAITFPNDEVPTSKTGGAKYVPGKSLAPREIEADDLGLKYTILDPWGIQLCFDPVYKSDGSAPERYRVYLVNDLRKSIIFKVDLRLKTQHIWQRVGQLESHAFFELGDLRYEELNQSPALDVDIREKLDMGTGPALKTTLKIKPKTFFKKTRTAPLLNRKVHHYVLFEHLDPSVPKPKKEDLKSYTRKQARKQPKLANSNLRRYETGLNLAAKAAFPTELDLHLEALNERPPKGKELSTQLAYFDRYLARAIELGVSRVFVIHGKGTGTLRDAIAARLRINPQVRDFNNGYLEKYDHGATEVFLD